MPSEQILIPKLCSTPQKFMAVDFVSPGEHSSTYELFLLWSFIDISFYPKLVDLAPHFLAIFSHSPGLEAFVPLRISIHIDNSRWKVSHKGNVRL